MCWDTWYYSSWSGERGITWEWEFSSYYHDHDRLLVRDENKVAINELGICPKNKNMSKN